jgi:hypothetical protein
MWKRIIGIAPSANQYRNVFTVNEKGTGELFLIVKGKYFLLISYLKEKRIKMNIHTSWLKIIFDKINKEHAR